MLALHQILILLSLLRFRRNLKQIPQKLKRAYDQRVYDRKNRKKGFAKVLPLYVQDKLARHHAYRKLVVPYILEQAAAKLPDNPGTKLKAVPQVFGAASYSMPALCTKLIKILEIAIYFLICLATSTALGIALSRLVPESAWQSWLGVLAQKLVGITPDGLGRFIGICAEAIAIIIFDIAITMIHGSFSNRWMPTDLKLFFRGLAAFVFSCAITMVGVTKTHDLFKETVANQKAAYDENYAKWKRQHNDWTKDQARLKAEGEAAEKKLPEAKNEYLRLRWGLAGLDLSLWEACESGAHPEIICPKPKSGPQTAAADAAVKKYTSAIQSAKDGLEKNEPEKPKTATQNTSDAYEILLLWAGIAICKLMRLLVLQAKHLKA